MTTVPSAPRGGLRSSKAASGPAPGTTEAALAYEVITTLLRVVNRINRGSHRSVGADIQLTLVETEVCLLISDVPGITAGEIAQRLAVSRSATSQVLTRLKEKGFVIETVDSVDAKRKHLHLTGPGTQAAQAGAAFFDRMKDDIFNTPRAELETYLDFVTKLDSFHSSVAEQLGRTHE